jgi:putative transcriptional regulator
VKDTVRNTVYELRTKQGITQEALADALGVSRQTVIAIERGNYAPSILLALKIGAFFKMPIERIFTIHD